MRPHQSFKQMTFAFDVFLRPVQSSFVFMYRLSRAILADIEHTKQLEMRFQSLSTKSEAALRSQFVTDISEWVSVKHRPFAPLSQPSFQSEKEEGVNCCVKPSLISGAGLGLFANRFLKKGTLIEFFDGRVVTSDSVKQFQSQTGQFCSHCISLGNLWVLDCSGVAPSAVKVLKAASFANSSGRPNATLRLKADRQGLTIVACLVAKYDIPRGDEIVFRYKFAR